MMRRLVVLFLSTLVMGSAALASGPKETADPQYEPYEPMASAKFLNDLSTIDHVTYFRGLFDAYLHFLDRGAVREETKKCLTENPWTLSQVTTSIIFRDYLRREKPGGPMTESLASMIRGACETLPELDRRWGKGTSSDREQASSPRKPYETMAAPKFLDGLSVYDQTTYFHGLYDSFRYYVSQDGNEETAQCLSDMEVSMSRPAVTDMFKQTLKTADGSEPLVAVLMRTFQDFCKGLKK